jgi:flavin-dependent dehydrogenase
LRYDVVVHGSDLTAVWLASRLHATGHRVLLIEEGPRLGGRHPYLPLLEGTVRASGIPRESLVRGPERLTVKLRLGERVVVRGSSERVFVVSVRRLAEMLTSEGCEAVTWCRPTFHRTEEGDFAFRTLSPQGDVSGTAEQLVSVQPIDPVKVAEVGALVPEGPVECALELTRRSMALKAPLSGKAVISVGSIQSQTGTFSRTWILAGRERRPEGWLELGEAAGDVLPPWAGDYTIESASIGLKLVEAALAEKEGAEEVLHEHRMRVMMRRALLNGIQSGDLPELDLDVFLEAFSPGHIRL